MITKHLLFFTLPLAALCAIPNGLAQKPNPITLEGIEVVKVAPPGGKREWVRMVCNFTNSGDWADGISFNYSVLVQPPAPGESTILTGGITYMNVPAGKSQAILYMSPNLLARFGTPIAAYVEVYRGERVVGTVQWGQPAMGTDAWTRSTTRDGVLLPSSATPFLVEDSERTADPAPR